MPNVKGAKRKTTAELALSGALDAKPGRYADRKNEIKPSVPLGTPPRHFTPEQKAIWKEVTKQLPPEVLFGSDRLLLEMTVKLTEKLRDGRIKAMEQHLLLSCLQQMGMTPIARSRISGPVKEKATNNLAALILPPVPTRIDVHPQSSTLH